MDEALNAMLDTEAGALCEAQGGKWLDVVGILFIIELGCEEYLRRGREG